MGILLPVGIEYNGGQGSAGYPSLGRMREAPEAAEFMWLLLTPWTKLMNINYKCSGYKVFCILNYLVMSGGDANRGFVMLIFRSSAFRGR